MGIVKLEGMEFYAYHGYYDEEQQVGNKYNVELAISMDFQQAADTDRLQNTVNYESLYRMVEEEMLVSSRLLEHIAQRIATRILHTFGEVEWAEITLSKYNPPIDGICKSATVVYRGEQEKIEN